MVNTVCLCSKCINTVYMNIPPGFADQTNDNQVCKLKKLLRVKIITMGLIQKIFKECRRRPVCSKS